MALWFALTALSVLFVAIDIVRTPESPVLKWAFVLVTAYIGPIGAFLYVLGCREPLPGLHEQYVAVRWRQVLGSTLHCVAGDGVGILTGAVIGSLVHMTTPAELALEYVLGFGFGWSIFQALFMRKEIGGTYLKALAKTFLPELLSMNMLMAGMIPVMMWAKSLAGGDISPLEPLFWFIMSMALLVGFVAAYPVNWWLVSNHLKHGMMTVRPPQVQVKNQGHANMAAPHTGPEFVREHGGHSQPNPVSKSAIIGMTVVTILVLALAVFASFAVLMPDN